jgi:hypothetical protein
MSGIKISNLCRNWGVLEAVNEGEFVALLGPWG